MAAVVVAHEATKARACVDSSAVEHYRLRGWDLVGVAAEPSSLETVDERDERFAAEAAAERAALSSKASDPAASTTTDKPSTRRGR